MSKITLKEFRKIKHELLELENKLNSNILSYNKFKINYYNILNKLLIHDLSAIPFSEWYGLSLLSNMFANLDFSNTHANLDFSLLKEFDFGSINLNGCRTRNIYVLYDYVMPDAINENNTKINIDIEIPEEIKKLIKDRKIEFIHISKYPSILKYINEHSFEMARFSPSRKLVESLGFNNALKLFKYYPEFILEITSYKKDLIGNFDFLDSVFDNNLTYQEAKELLFKDIILEIKKGRVFPKRENLPKEIFKKYPKIFILEKELPESVLNNYYDGILSISEIRKYIDIFKKKDLDIGIRNKRYYKWFNEDFNIFKYIQNYPQELDIILDTYLMSNNLIATRDIIKSAIKNYFKNTKEINLELIKACSLYLPLEDIVKNKALIEFIEKCGLNNLIEFNNINNNILNLKINSLSFIELISEYNYLLKNKITNQKSLLKELENIIKAIRSYEEVYLNRDTKRKLGKVFKNEFLDYDLLDKLLNEHNIEDSKKETIINMLEIGFDSETDILIDILNNYSFLTEVIKGKDFYLKPIYYLLYNNIGNNNFIEACSKYGSCLIEVIKSFYYHGDIAENLGKHDYEEELNRYIFMLLNERIEDIDFEFLPLSFKKKYPDLFLENENEKLTKLFYRRNITPLCIQNNPEWIDILKSKNIEIVCNEDTFYFVNKCKKLGLDNQKILELFKKYGSFLIDCHINLDNTTDIDKSIIKEIIEAINLGARYNEDAKDLLGVYAPELFLDEDAPDILKEVFYNYTDKTPLTFELLRDNKNWLKYLKGKNVLLSLKKGNPSVQGLDELFRICGNAEALKIIIKNPHMVRCMLICNKAETLVDWYYKLNFIPHYIVMREFPLLLSDKFIVSEKKWSQIMKLKYNITDEDTMVLLKSSMCFGVFDDDKEGYNKVMYLFNGLPKILSFESVTKIQEFDKDNLIDKCYKKSSNGYILINILKNKEIASILRDIMEKAHIKEILTHEKAFAIFSKFDMKYKPDFRDFMFKYMNEILENKEYIEYIGVIEKYWEDIKAFNSNRTLDLDKALAFVKTYAYENVELGNETLASLASKIGYDNRSFNILQEIYNHGKKRVYSSIPRIRKKTKEYTYEILRLDDPLALIIGPLSNCCQELGNYGETTMEHSMVDKNGRIFVIKDNEGNLVAQSWVWRNKNVLCFDNIEIPEKAFIRAKYKGLTEEEFTDIILMLYKEASNELLRIDELEFKNLLRLGKITKEQYQALKLGKITIGKGNNDIGDSLKEFSLDSFTVRPLDFKPVISLYYGLYTDDSDIQYIIAGKESVVTSNYDTLAIYKDDFYIYDNTNTKKEDIFKLLKLEYSTKNMISGKIVIHEDNLVSSIGQNYGFNINNTRIIMNNNMAIIYDFNDTEIIIGDILFNRPYLDKVIFQIRIAIDQIRDNKKIKLESLNEEQTKIFFKALSLDEEIDQERGIKHGK